MATISNYYLRYVCRIIGNLTKMVYVPNMRADRDIDKCIPYSPEDRQILTLRMRSGIYLWPIPKRYRISPRFDI